MTITPSGVIYRETVIKNAQATVRYTMPKPCWAVMTFNVEPGALNSGDFLLATPMGIMAALKNAGTRLLEPFYALDIKAPQKLLGTITNDLNNMRADLGIPRFEGNLFALGGTVAVAPAMDYSIRFNACCSGKVRLKLTLGGYQFSTSSQWTLENLTFSGLEGHGGVTIGWGSDNLIRRADFPARITEIQKIHGHPPVQ
ncbi:putative translation elongation factor [Desulforapulum autotrophicum HRM2]|uniref:Translation elongation factor n=1 Tax=Desulforapulum autotrophicum (strain ATCC 43914 / DSM 3382 / VKM B-1955 / HRM2) TaxID=177437 RepID=C0QBB7_DESAH|nr:translation elongation factor [Desulforapulum autotrophicum]ACN16919.1 putative translation elongation factor [Desulforapulum autotrophicum HRM2]